jgi:hypothetical protein
MKWNDVQQTGGIVINGVINTVVLNGQSASGLGLDVGITARPVERLTLGLGASWNDLVEDENVFTGLQNEILAIQKGKRLNYSSEYTATASTDYTILFGGSGFSGTLSASGTYLSKQFYTAFNANAPSAVASGDPMFFGRAAFTLIAPQHWTAMLYADNVNNERGIFPDYPTGVDFSRRMRPRTMGIQFSYSFE